MQITNSVVCGASKGCIYKLIKPPLVGEHAFSTDGVCLQVGPRYIWWQRWNNDNCKTGVALPICFPGHGSGRDFSEGKVM